MSIMYIFREKSLQARPAGGNLHFINKQEYGVLLLLTESGPTIQKLLLRSSKRDGSISFCKKLRQCNAKSGTDFFQRGNGRNHIFAIPGGDGRLGQTGAFSQLILGPPSIFPVFCDGCKNVFHNAHPFTCVFRKLYCNKSLQFNNSYRIITTTNTSA